MTRGRTTLLLCYGARHHKIINHHAVVLSLSSVVFLIKLVTHLENRGRLESLVPKRRHLKRSVLMLRAEARSERSSLTPVGQTASLLLRGPLSLFSGSFPFLEALVGICTILTAAGLKICSVLI